MNVAAIAIARVNIQEADQFWVEGTPTPSMLQILVPDRFQTGKPLKPAAAEANGQAREEKSDSTVQAEGPTAASVAPCCQA